VFAPNLDELTRDAAGGSWVAEDAEAHLMPHVRAACDAEHSLLRVVDADLRDDVLVIDLAWLGETPGPDAVRAEAFRVLGSFAEHTTHVRQRSTGQATDVEISTRHDRRRDAIPQARTSRVVARAARMSGIVEIMAHG